MVVRSEGIGHHEDFFVLLDDDAADEYAAVFFGDLVAVVLVADDLARVDDVLQQISQGVAVASAGEVWADAAAFAVEAVAGGAHGAAVHGLAIGEVAAFHTCGGEGDGFIERVVFPGAFGGDVVWHRGHGFDFIAQRVEGGEFRLWDEGFEGVFADVFDEAFEAVAALPGAGTGEPTEEGLAVLGGPSGGGISQGEHVVDLLGIRAATSGGAGGVGVAVVAAQHGIGGDFLEVILGGGHEGEGLAHDLLAVDGDEDLAELAVDLGVVGGEERIERGGDLFADVGIRFAEAGQDELQGTQGGEFVAWRRLDGTEGEKDAVLQFDVLRLDGRDGLTGGGFGLGGGFSAFVGGCGSADAGEGNEGLNGGDGLFFAEGFFLPKFDRELLNGDAGGVAHMAVAVAEIAPSHFEGFVGLDLPRVIALKRGTHLELLIQRQRFDGSGGFLAHVGDAIDAGLRFAAADGKVHRAVLRMDDEIGERQRFAKDEFFLGGEVAGAFAFEMNGPHGAVGPVVDEDGVLVFRGELGPGASDDAGGAARADVERGG